MSACEHCWSQSDGYEHYLRTLADAERSGAACTKDTMEGKRLRAGQWWDEATQRDTRKAVTVEVVPRDCHGGA